MEILNIEASKVKDVVGSIISGGGRLIHLFGIDYGRDFFTVNYLFTQMSRREYTLVRTIVSKDNPKVPTITDKTKAALWPEREWSEMLGIEFTGHPDPRNLFLPFKEGEEGYRVKGIDTVVIGPHHPLLIEGIMFVLGVRDGEVVDVDIKPGFNHRGIMKLAENRNWWQNQYLVERVCGICSTAHALCYVNTVEKIFGAEIPRRARLLRTLVAELNRIQSHLLLLGIYGDLLGASKFFIELWRVREKVLDLIKLVIGYRVHYNYIVPGGVRSDISGPDIDVLISSLKDIEKECRELYEVYTSDKTIVSKSENVGKLSTSEALEWGVVGPIARGSGVEYDVRIHDPYEIYGELEWDTVVEKKGDCFSRILVEFKEVFESINMCLQILDLLRRIDDGIRGRLSPTIVEKEAFMRVEAPRGELFYYIVAENYAKPLSLIIRTPTYANIPVLHELMKRHRLSDIPSIIGSFDLCMACLDRAIVIDDKKVDILSLRNLAKGV